MWRGGVFAIAAAAVAGGAGCSGSEDMAPFRPRPDVDAGPREDGGQQRDAGGMDVPAKRPTGVELEEMIAALKPFGLDLGDPDRVCAGWAHACAIDFSGKVRCFPEHEDGRSTPPIRMLPRKKPSAPSCTILSATAWVMSVALIGSEPPTFTFILILPFVAFSTCSAIFSRPTMEGRVATGL